MDLTQGSIWRPFFGRRIPSSLAPRAIYAAPLATPSSTPLFGLFWLPRQKYDLELDFLADFHIFCRELPHVSRNASRFEVARFKKKLRPSEDTSFSRFLSAHIWAHRSNQFSIKRRLCFSGSFLRKISKIWPNPPSLSSQVFW